MGSSGTGSAEKDTILLFYREFEQDKFFKNDRYLKRMLKPLYNLTHHRQKKTGFAVSFELLRRALQKHGWKVRINDYALARKYPRHPVGLVGCMPASTPTNGSTPVRTPKTSTS
jgi:hypothetical protein